MLLPDLRIRNYRLFKEFEIERLARVNLVAGRNNTGKSALLEAAYLVANQQHPHAVYDVLQSRGWEGGAREWPFGSLLHGYWLPAMSSMELFAGEDFVRFVLGEVKLLPSGEGSVLLRIEYATGEAVELTLREEDGTGAFGVIPSGSPRRAHFLSGGISLADRFGELTALWETLLFTPGEEQVIEALRFLEPRVERLAFTRRDILVRLAGSDRPVRLGDLGGGMHHLLMIALLLATSEDELVLIDEVDTGLHYTVLIDLWRLIFRTAKRLNVQVLATTHSWDCITAFSQAWNEVEESEGLYLRLDRRKDRIRSVTYTAEGLSICREQGIEVR